ncbi:MAG: prolipoprotein diacylglyceryl transferase [Oscillospiraceae bacterium]|nr:prolipoprotein diacylglyceryl transferase [Oscillospiraceae bacterium]
MLSAITFPGLGLSLNLPSVALNLFGKDIFWYGIIIACGFVAAYLYMNARAPRFGLTQDNLLDMVLWAVPFGIIGARIYYCVFYWDLYRADPISCLYIWEGGLAIYGAVIGGVIGVALCGKIRKLPIPVLLDLASFGVLIGQIFGRWGNFFNQEAHGGETTSFLRMGLLDSDGVVRYYHPTFLYESVWNLVGLIGLHLISKKRKFDGQMFLLYLFWYGLGRVWIEGMRTDSLYLFSTGIRVSQLLAAICVVAAGGLVAYVLLVRKPSGEKLYVNRLAAEKQAAGEEQKDAAEECSQ